MSTPSTEVTVTVEVAGPLPAAVEVASYRIIAEALANAVRIRTVASGGAVFSPTVADRLGRFFTGLATGGGREAFPQLTDREMEILDLVARGLENRRIARELHLSDKTVRNHVSNVLTKLGVAHRSEAIARARVAGLGG